jgi:hypothetical protein
MVAACSSETSVSAHKNTGLHNPEDQDFYSSKLHLKIQLLSDRKHTTSPVQNKDQSSNAVYRNNNYLLRQPHDNHKYILLALWQKS